MASYSLKHVPILSIRNFKDVARKSLCFEKLSGKFNLGQGVIRL